jgi:dsRNA-specific ribonuclease
MNDVIAYEKKENIPYMAPFELKAFQRGMEEGREREAQQMLLAALDIRFGPPSEELTERVQAITDTAVLQELHRQALLADSLEAFMAALPET